MTDKNAAAAVEPLLPVELGPGKIKFAQGMKAGRWVFATGVMAQDFRSGIAPEVLAEHAPHSGAPKREKEALRIFENIDAVLGAAGTDRANLVRTDQYYTTVKAVPPYQQVRREFLRGRIPPSTSIGQQGLLLPGADMNIQALGVIPQQGFEVTHHKHEALAGRPTSGYSPAVTVRDFIFIPGITSLAVGNEPPRNGVAAKRRAIDAGVPTAFRHQPQAMKAGDLLFMSGLMAFDGHGLAASVATDPRQPQFSSSAEAQAEFIIGNIAKLCEAAGTSLSNVVRVLQFHTDIREFYPVYKVWERRFGGRPVPFSAVEVPAPLPVPGATMLIEAWAYAP